MISLQTNVSLKLAPWKVWGFLFGTIAAIFCLYAGYLEFKSCSPDWPSMCGLGFAMFSWIGGGFPALVLIASSKIMALFPFADHAEVPILYLVTALAFFAEYFAIGGVLGSIYTKLKSKNGTIAIVYATLVSVGVVLLMYWLLLMFHG